MPQKSAVTIQTPSLRVAACDNAADDEAACKLARLSSSLVLTLCARCGASAGLVKVICSWLDTKVANGDPITTAV